MSEVILNRNLNERIKRLLNLIDLNAYEKSIVNLGKSTPDTNILLNCCVMFQKASSHRMNIEAKNQAELFEYGPPAGNFDICNQLATFLTDCYEMSVERENIFVTTGASQGLQLILSTLLDPNGYVFVDEVTYMFALDVFKQFPLLNLISVKLHDNGVDVKELRELVKRAQFESRHKSYWALYFAVPTFHNPTGIVFSNDVCNSLIKLAREFDILLSCDDVYNIYYYNTESPPKRLFAYDDPNDSDFRDNVISNGSFSKVIGPGLRFGWIEARPRCKTILENSGFLRSGGCLNNYTAGIMSSAIELGLVKSHVNKAKQLYHERMLAVIKILENSLPESCSFVKPSGGLFIWIRLPMSVDATDLLKFCLVKYEVYFITGEHFSIEKEFKNYMRISVANYSKEILADAVSKICNAITIYLQSKH